MRSNDIFEGQWIRFQTSDTKDTFTGFVIEKRSEEARIAIPSIQKTRTIPFVIMHDFEGTKHTIEDIDEMIDIALDTRDFEWVCALNEMKGVLLQWQ